MDEKNEKKIEKEIEEKEKTDAYGGNDKAGPLSQAPEETGGTGAEETPDKGPDK